MPGAMCTDETLVQKYWNVLPRFCNDEDQEYYEELNLSLIDAFSLAGHRTWARSINLWRKIRSATLRARMRSGRRGSNIEKALDRTPEEEEFFEVTTEQLRRVVKFALETSNLNYGTDWRFNDDQAEEIAPSARDKRNNEEIASPPAPKRVRREDETAEAEEKSLVYESMAEAMDGMNHGGGEQCAKANGNMPGGKGCGVRDIRAIFDSEDDDDEVEMGEAEQGINENRAVKFDLIEDNIDEEKHNNDDREAQTPKRRKTNGVDEGEHGETDTGNQAARLERIRSNFGKEKQDESEQDREAEQWIEMNGRSNNLEIDLEMTDTVKESGSTETRLIDGPDRNIGDQAVRPDRVRCNSDKEKQDQSEQEVEHVRRSFIPCEDGYIHGNNYSEGKHRNKVPAKPGGQLPNENPVRIQELGLKILVTHRGQYISEEDLYGMISEYGEVELMTDANGGDLEELPVFPSNIWIRYTKEELNNLSNPIFSLNKADLSIIHTSYQRIWTYNQELRCFKNISGEQWRRGRWDVVTEADVEGLIEDGSKIIISLKKGKDWTGHYTRETYVAYTGTKASCTAEGDSICMENALRTTTIIVPGRQESSRAKLHSACVFLTSTSTIQII